MNAFLTGKELKEALAILPQYDDRIRNATTGERLLALNNLFNLYYPSPMAAEIYSKLYLAYVRAMQKKHTLAAVRQGRHADRPQVGAGLHLVPLESGRRLSGQSELSVLVCGIRPL